jgi:divalent metal cation (Fe/Co/Zn/Cd) transporter
MTYALSFVAIIGVIIMLFAGFQILTSASDDKKVSSAKSMIMYAAMGMIIMFFAWSVTIFVIRLVG